MASSPLPPVPQRMVRWERFEAPQSVVHLDVAFQSVKLARSTRGSAMGEAAGETSRQVFGH